MNHCYIFIGPSGSGKTSLASALFSSNAKIISYTTRPPRPNETHKTDYYFITKPEFEEMIATKQFAEYDDYDQNYYGVTIQSIKDALAKGDCYNALTPTGFWHLRGIFKEQIVPVFITISKETVKKRLMTRQSNPKEVQARLQQYQKDQLALKDLQKIPDLIVINGETSLTEMVQQFKCAFK